MDCRRNCLISRHPIRPCLGSANSKMTNYNDNNLRKIFSFKKKTCFLCVCSVVFLYVCYVTCGTVVVLMDFYYLLKFVYNNKKPQCNIIEKYTYIFHLMSFFLILCVRISNDSKIRQNYQFWWYGVVRVVLTTQCRRHSRCNKRRKYISYIHRISMYVRLPILFCLV